MDEKLEKLEDQLKRLASSREKSIAVTNYETALLIEEQAGVSDEDAKRHRRAARLWADKADRLALEADRTDTGRTDIVHGGEK